MGHCLIYIGDDKKLDEHLEEVCSEIGLVYNYAKETSELDRFSSNVDQHSVVVEMDKVKPLSLSEKKKLSSAAIQVIILSANDTSDGNFDATVIETDGLEKKEQAMKVLDELLSSVRTEVNISEHFEPVNFDYLKSTFSEKDQRYKQLIDMMFIEFLEAKEIMSEAFDKGDIEKYREYKHKLQPSANYLRMNDLINVMEAIKQNFDHLDEKRNKHLVPKMMKYFDTILEALATEKS